MLNYFLIIFGCICCLFCNVCVSEEDHGTLVDIQYQKGKVALNALLSSTECFRRQLRRIQDGCSDPENGKQSLATQLAICHLDASGRPFKSADCDLENDERFDWKSCCASMSEEAFAVHVHFLTEMDDICFYLKADLFREDMDFRLRDLRDQSQFASDRLREFSAQMDLSASRQAAAGQRLESLVATLLDMNGSLVNLVHGWSSKLLFYLLSVVVLVLLTMTGRTSAARAPLLLALVSCLVLEHLLVNYFCFDGSSVSSPLTTDGLMCRLIGPVVRQCFAVGAVGYLTLRCFTFQSQTQMLTKVLNNQERLVSAIQDLVSILNSNSNSQKQLSIDNDNNDNDNDDDEEEEDLDEIQLKFVARYTND